MSVRAVAWDIDGTLVDSEPLHLYALQETCRRYGVSIDDLPDDEFIGVNLFGVWDVLKERHPESVSMQEWIHELNRFYDSNAKMLKPIPGAREVVGKLSESGFIQVAVSNSHRRVVDANLEAVGLTKQMQFSLSLDDVPIGKPDPTPYRMVLDALKLTPNQVIAVEDSPSGVSSAAAAGLTVFGLSNGKTDLSGADYTIDRLGEIFTFFDVQTDNTLCQKI